MKEFMLLIRKEGESTTKMSAEEHQQFLNGCMVYIQDLMKNGKLISAQPLVREGVVISGTPGAFKDGPFNETKEVMVGYYHILAADLDEAMAIAKRNPEFAYSTNTKIEVRPIKMKEESTSFVYPSGK